MKQGRIRARQDETCAEIFLILLSDEEVADAAERAAAYEEMVRVREAAKTAARQSEGVAKAQSAAEAGNASD
jgi:hypothetical protein